MTGLEHIAQTFAQTRTAFMPYVPLGYPTVEDSLAIVRALVEAGADMLELGVPFSDPLADGPTIQAATQRALQNGVTVESCLHMARQLRAEGIAVPFLLMGYLNPFLAYGLERLVREAAATGVDGFIIPDLPPEEAGDFDALCAAHGLAPIYFLAPTSTPERVALVSRKGRGFLYLVSLTGVTGARDALSETLPAFIGRVRAATSLPLAVGFGISNGAQARQVAQHADGVIVGSALVKRAAQSVQAVRELAAEISAAL
ncbi:MAG: tryptophan synthase subunit alpha [Caldilineae bacterium]|nr:MAG: tryptophan synthase subunit alpha [Caldilineae bacterium]